MEPVDLSTLTPKQLCAEWVALLRSETLPQGRSAMGLINTDGSYCYCPLGVLHKLLGTQGVPSQLTKTVSFNGLTGRLDSKTRERVNLSEEDEQRILVMNDLEHKSFQEIASWIEERLVKGNRLV